MKVTVDNKVDKKKVEYPWIGISVDNGVIVLFSDESTGTILDSGNSNDKVGTWYDCWDAYKFKEFEGIITLEN